MQSWETFMLGVIAGMALLILITVIMVVLRSIRRDENGKK